MPSDRVIGVDLGGTKVLIGVVDESLGVLARVTRPAQGGDREALLARIVDGVREAAAVCDGSVGAIGFGIPSLIDTARGVAVSTVHLPLAEFPFAAVMSERLGLPVVVDNDANCAMVCEHRFGAAVGASHAALLTLGTGIGGGLVVDGRVVRGAVGAGAELGHMVIDFDGPPCQGNCPNRGCLEAFCSGSAIARAGEAAASRDPSSALASSVPLTGAVVTEAAVAGDGAARAVVRRAGEALGVGIANLVNMLNPSVVVVGGGVMAAGDLLLGPAREVVAARALAPSRDVVRIEPAAFGADAGMLGASLLARDVLVSGVGA